MRILVLGCCYDSNLGDGVICQCVAALLEREFPQAQVCIRDLVARTAFQTPHPADLDVLRRRFFRTRLRRAVTEYTFWDKQLSSGEYGLASQQDYIHRVCAEHWDLAVFAGGQMFMDALALYVAEYTRMLSQAGVPVLFNACGAGPAVSPGVRRRLGQALREPGVQLISCRDHADLIAKTYDVKTRETADAALWAPEIYGISRQTDAQVIGIGSIYSSSIPPRQVERCLTALIRTLEKRGLSWKLFVNGDPGDLAFAQLLLKRMGPNYPEEQYLAPPPGDPRELVALVAQLRGVLSFRLHSHILAWSLGVPSAALIWDDKLPCFFQKIGQPQRCFPPDAPAEQVCDALLATEISGQERQEYIRQREAARALLLDEAHRALNRSYHV